jgi:hypothetical protein
MATQATLIRLAQAQGGKEEPSTWGRRIRNWSRRGQLGEGRLAQIGRHTGGRV